VTRDVLKARLRSSGGARWGRGRAWALNCGLETDRRPLSDTGGSQLHEVDPEATAGSPFGDMQIQFCRQLDHSRSGVVLVSVRVFNLTAPNALKAFGVGHEKTAAPCRFPVRRPFPSAGTEIYRSCPPGAELSPSPVPRWVWVQE
jgi:hypothetical protein